MALETGTAQKAAAAAAAKARRRAALVADDNKPLPKRTRRLQAKRTEGPPLSSPHYMLVSAAIPDSSIAWEVGTSGNIFTISSMFCEDTYTCDHWHTVLTNIKMP